MAEKSKSIWVWLGCGCGTVVLVGLAVIGGLTFFGIRAAKTMADPEARLDKALTILSAAAIPREYETEVALSVPFFAKVVVLEGDARQFVYLGGLRTKADLAAAFDDDDSFDAELRRAGLKIRRRQEILARDALRVGAAEVRYVLVDGDVSFEPSGGRGRSNFDFDPGELADDHAPEISAVVLLRCSEQETPGLGLWAGPRAADDTGADGPAADQAALVDLIERFGFCGG